MNKFDELLAKLKGLRENADDGNPSAPVEFDVARHVRALRTGYALLMEPVTIRPGDIVRGRKELAEAMTRDYEKPHILIEILPRPVPLELDSEHVADSTAAKRYDCIIGTMVSHPQRGGPFFITYYADIREWELYPGIDTLTDKEALAS